MAFFRRRRRRGDKDSGRAPNDRDTTGFPDRIPPSSYPCHVSTRSRVSSRRLNRVDPLSLFFSLTNLSSEFLERGSKRIICIVTERFFAINRDFRGIRLEQRQKRKNSLELIARAFSSILSLSNKKEERIRSCVSFSPYFPNRSEFPIPFLRA